MESFFLGQNCSVIFLSVLQLLPRGIWAVISLGELLFRKVSPILQLLSRGNIVQSFSIDTHCKSLWCFFEYQGFIIRGACDNGLPILKYMLLCVSKPETGHVFVGENIENPESKRNIICIMCRCVCLCVYLCVLCIYLSICLAAQVIHSTKMVMVYQYMTKWVNK